MDMEKQIGKTQTRQNFVIQAKALKVRYYDRDVYNEIKTGSSSLHVRNKTFSFWASAFMYPFL